MQKKHLIGYPLAALLAVGIGAAAAGNSDAATVATPGPTVTAIKTTTATLTPQAVTKTLTKTETKTATTNQVPQVCLAALAAGEDVSVAGGKALTAAGEVIGSVPDLIDAVVAMDTGKIDEFTALAQDNTATLGGLNMDALVSTYKGLADDCRQQ